MKKVLALNVLMVFGLSPLYSMGMAGDANQGRLASILHACRTGLAYAAEKTGQGLSYGAQKGSEGLSWTAHKVTEGLSYTAHQGAKGLALLLRKGREGAPASIDFVKRHPKAATIAAGTAVASGVAYKAIKSPRGQDGLSYLSRIAKSGLSKVSEVAKPVLDNVSQFAKPALNFLNNQSQTTKIIAGTLAASGMAYAAGRAIRRWMAHAEATEVTTDDFQAALDDWAFKYDAYEEQVERVKQGMTFLVPAMVGARTLGGLRAQHADLSHAANQALGQASDIWSLMRTLGNYPLDKGVRCLSYIPIPRILNTLRERRIQEKEAWKNIERVIREKNITADDLDKFVRDNHTVKLTGTIMAKLRGCIQGNPNRQNTGQDRRQVKWKGPVPQEMAELIEQINDPEDFGDVPFPRGVLMLGDPGLGKSFAVEYIGQETGLPVETISAPDIFSKWVSEAGKSISSTYKKAASIARATGRPSIVFIDEADAILEDRQRGDDTGGHKKAQQEILDTLFPLMDGPNAVQNVITIFASNMPQEYFDKALTTRTRRITHVIHMQYPDEATCLKMLRHAARKHRIQTAPLLEQANAAILQNIAHQAHENHFTPDNLYGLIEQAVRTAIANERRIIAGRYQPQAGQEVTDQQDAQMRQEMRQAQRNATVTQDILTGGLRAIIARRGAGVPAGQGDHTAAQPRDRSGEFFAQMTQQNQTLQQLLQTLLARPTGLPGLVPAPAQQMMPHQSVPVTAPVEHIGRRPRVNSLSSALHPGLIGDRARVFAALHAPINGRPLDLDNIC